MKMFKRFLPLLCAVLLIIGSSMTVLAASYVLPTNLPDGSNWVILQADDSTYEQYGCRYYLFYCKGRIGYDKSTSQFFLLTSAGNYASETTDFTKCKNTGGGYSSIASPSDHTFKLIASNSNIYIGSYKSLSVTDEVFYKAPLIVVKSAEALTGTVQAQTKMILPVAVGCLALLIGSIVLLPRLRIFL